MHRRLCTHLFLRWRFSDLDSAATESAKRDEMDIGFLQATTLAEGGERCDFRWKKSQETRRAWPPAWLERDHS
jgi:hypothetical protein